MELTPAPIPHDPYHTSLVQLLMLSFILQQLLTLARFEITLKQDTKDKLERSRMVLYRCVLKRAASAAGVLTALLFAYWRDIDSQDRHGKAWRLSSG